MTSPISVADVLERAADLIEPEGAWTQGWFARDKEGEEVNITSPRAVCFCALGAIGRIAGDFGSFTWRVREFAEAAAGLAATATQVGLVAFNDAPTRTQGEVVSALREAAAKARSPHVRGDGE